MELGSEFPQPHIYISKLLLWPQMSQGSVCTDKCEQREGDQETQVSACFAVLQGTFPREECWQLAVPWRPALQGGWRGLGWRLIHLEITRPFHWTHMNVPQQFCSSGDALTFMMSCAYCSALCQLPSFTPLSRGLQPAHASVPNR